MTSVKNKNIAKPGNVEKCYFIKPFEILSSYSSFINTWKVANKIYKNTAEVSDAKLMQSLSESSIFGFISYSKWLSKKAFIKSNISNPVLKYHNVLNGNGSNSTSQYLYKLIPVCPGIKNNIEGNLSEVIIINSAPETDIAVKNYFMDLCEKSTENILSVALFKAIFKKSKYRFICIINRKDSSKPFVKRIKNIEFKIYSSFFKTVKKY